MLRALPIVAFNAKMLITRSRGPAEPGDSAAAEPVDSAAMPSSTTSAPAAASVPLADAAKSPDRIEEEVFYDALTYDITTSAKKEISEALKHAYRESSVDGLDAQDLNAGFSDSKEDCNDVEYPPDSAKTSVNVGGDNDITDNPSADTDPDDGEGKVVWQC